MRLMAPRPTWLSSLLLAALWAGCGPREVSQNDPCAGDRCADANTPDASGTGDDATTIDDADTVLDTNVGTGGDTSTDTSDPADGDTTSPMPTEPPVILETGTTSIYRLLGTVITPDGPIEGEVVVVDDLITCVAADCSAQVPSGGWLIDTRGIILPGLIDTHNHILFDVFDEDDWVPTLPKQCNTVEDCVAGSSYCTGDKCDCVDAVCRYRNHDQWPKEDEYAVMLDYKQCLEDASQGKPDWCPKELDEDGDVKCEMHKWGEIKGLVAGTTSIVGLPGTTSKCVSGLARSIDVTQNGLEGDKIQTSALFPPSKSSADGVCANYADGDTDAYIIHVGEGVDAESLEEFDDLWFVTTEDGCLFNSRTTITHGTAFGPAEFAEMGVYGMKLVWSPQSNVSLYGRTTDIPAAMEAGVAISLAPDWSMGGSQNLLEELRFADRWDNERWGDVLTPRMLYEMVTENPAEVLGLSDQLGRLEAGYIADIMVISKTDGTPYEALLQAHPQDVRLVMVGGVALAGDLALEAIAPQEPGCEVLSACGVDRFVCIAENTTDDKRDQTLLDIESTLEWAIGSIDDLEPKDPSACGGCDDDEECYAYGAKPEVDEAMCPAPCNTGEVCIEVKKSGTDRWECLPRNSCSPRKSDLIFAPLSPLVRCPGG